MRIAYVDSSAMLAIAFKEDPEIPLSRRFEGFDELVSSNLLDAELRSAHAREGKPMQDELLFGVRWILPERPLRPEIDRVLESGYVRGADAWHLAVALSMVDDPADLTFITLDDRQREVAEELGFRT